MYKRLIMGSVIVSIVIFASNTAFSETFMSDNNIDVIPYVISVNEQGGNISVKSGVVTITANKGTDLFTNTTGDKSADNSPRVLFEPNGDFIFSAKVSTEFKGAYDGGALIVYANNQQWAKLLFERFKSGKNGIATTVSTIKGDDAYHGTREANSQYLKIARHDTSYVFYTSTNGHEWNFERHFSLDTSIGVQIGFTAQSPLTDALEVTFSNIRYKGERFKSYWQGE